MPRLSARRRCPPNLQILRCFLVSHRRVRRRSRGRRRATSLNHLRRVQRPGLFAVRYFWPIALLHSMRRIAVSRLRAETRRRMDSLLWRLRCGVVQQL